MLDDPRCPVSAGEIDAIADADARENWQHMIAFRDHLLAHPTIEAAYLSLVREGTRVPPLFLDQLVHVILRNMLDQTGDAYLLRAAEMFFRPQRLTTHEGSLIAADEEHVGAAAGASPLVAMLGLPLAGNIDVLNDDNAASYWERSDRFDMALDLSAGRRGLAALGEVIERWLKHLLAVEVAVEPLTEPGDVALSWYVGLDAEATRIGDALWKGGALDADERASIVAFYRLTFSDPGIVLDGLADEPVYLILAMTSGRSVAHEAAEPGNRPADPRTGGRLMSSARTAGAHFASASLLNAARQRAHGRISCGGRFPCSPASLRRHRGLC